MRKKYYCYVFSNGLIKYFTPEEANNFQKAHPNLRVLKDGYQRHRDSPVVMKKDAFRPGFQEHLGCYVGGKREYNNLLKERGLIEAGKEYVAPTTEKPVDIMLNREELRDIRQEVGNKISDRELDHIKEVGLNNADTFHGEDSCTFEGGFIDNGKEIPII